MAYFYNYRQIVLLSSLSTLHAFLLQMYYSFTDYYQQGPDPLWKKIGVLNGVVVSICCYGQWTCTCNYAKKCPTPKINNCGGKFFVYDRVWLTEKRKKEIRRNRIFLWCDYSTEQKVRLNLRIALQMFHLARVLHFWYACSYIMECDSNSV